MINVVPVNTDTSSNQSILPWLARKNPAGTVMAFPNKTPGFVNRISAFN